jgi:hypothetical protein
VAAISIRGVLVPVGESRQRPNEDKQERTRLNGCRIQTSC